MDKLKNPEMILRLGSDMSRGTATTIGPCRMSNKDDDWLMSIKVISTSTSPVTHCHERSSACQGQIFRRINLSCFGQLILKSPLAVSCQAASQISEADVEDSGVVKQKLVRAWQNGAVTGSISSVPCMEKRALASQLDPCSHSALSSVALSTAPGSLLQRPLSHH